jgi:hypothetical protein
MTKDVGLTAEERSECEIEGKYGDWDSSIEIDHKGRIFAHTWERANVNNDKVVIFNEAVVGRESVLRLRALCDYWLTPTSEVSDAD